MKGTDAGYFSLARLDAMVKSVEGYHQLVSASAVNASDVQLSGQGMPFHAHHGREDLGAHSERSFGG